MHQQKLGWIVRVKRSMHLGGLSATCLKNSCNAKYCKSTLDYLFRISSGALFDKRNPLYFTHCKPIIGSYRITTDVMNRKLLETASVSNPNYECFYLYQNI